MAETSQCPCSACGLSVCRAVACKYPGLPEGPAHFLPPSTSTSEALDPLFVILAHFLPVPSTGDRPGVRMPASSAC